MSKTGKAIFITGASSGIGAALAREYAEEETIIGLAARREERLNELKKECQELGAKVQVYALDVTDGSACDQAARDFLKHAKRIDLVIANAGIGGWDHPLKSEVVEMTTMIDVNVNGVINIISAFLPQLVKQQQGQIAAVSSIASFRGLPGGVYAASKAAIRYLMDGWRIDLADDGIGVTTVFPGFVSSELTKSANRPFLISSQRAAQLIRYAIDRRYRYFVLPWQWWILIPIMKLAPDYFFRLYRRHNSK